MNPCGLTALLLYTNFFILVAELVVVAVVSVVELGLVVDVIKLEVASASVELDSSLLNTTLETMSFSVSRGGMGEMPSFLSIFSKHACLLNLSIYISYAITRCVMLITLL